MSFEDMLVVDAAAKGIYCTSTLKFPSDLHLSLNLRFAVPERILSGTKYRT